MYVRRTGLWSLGVCAAAHVSGEVARGAGRNEPDMRHIAHHRVRVRMRGSDVGCRGDDCDAGTREERGLRCRWAAPDQLNVRLFTQVPLSLSLFVPSGQVVLLQVMVESVALANVALVSVAPVRLAPVRLAPLTSAPASVALVRLAPLRPAPVTLALVSVALARFRW